MELNPIYLLKFLLLYQEIRFYLPHSSTIIGESGVEFSLLSLTNWFVVVSRRELDDSVEQPYNEQTIGSTVVEPKINAQFWVSVVSLAGVDVSIWQFCSSD